MWDQIINIHLSELLSTKTKESRINKLLKKKCFTITKKKNMDNLYLYLIISIQIFLKN